MHIGETEHPHGAVVGRSC